MLSVVMSGVFISKEQRVFIAKGHRNAASEHTFASYRSRAQTMRLISVFNRRQYRMLNEVREEGNISVRRTAQRTPTMPHIVSYNKILANTVTW